MKKFLMSVCLILGSCSHYRTDSYDEYAEAAQSLYEKQEYQEALAILDQIEAEDLLSSPLVLIQCESLERTKQVPMAKACYEKARALYPHKSVFELKLLGFHIEEDQLEQAQALIAQLESRLGSDQAFLRMKADFAFKSNNWDQASTWLEKSLSIQKNDQDYLNLGKARFLSGKTREARTAFEQITDTGLTPTAARYLAWIYIDAKEQRLANDQIRLLLKHQPEDALTKKLFLRNLTLSQDADRVTLIREYNRQFEDDWGQYNYWKALKEINADQEANDYIAQLWNKNKSEAWVASHYANELAQQNNIAAAQAVLQDTLRVAHKHHRESISYQLAEISSRQELMRNLASIRTHRVERGETLESISAKFYGTKNRWNDILKHNLALIQHPERLKVGTDLTIPGYER